MTNPAYEATNSDVEKLIALIKASREEDSIPILLGHQFDQLIAALEAANALNKHLELAIRKAEGCSEALRRRAEAAENRIAELEAAPNGMMQLSNELAAKSVVIGELGFLENLERIIGDRDRDIDIGQLGHENYQALMVAALDAFRSAAGQVKGSS